jgi:hypothetical protein
VVEVTVYVEDEVLWEGTLDTARRESGIIE